MNIGQSFVEYMEDLALGVFGDDIFIGSAPLDSQDNIWWVVTQGGGPISTNQTGERMKSYVVSVYYRNLSAADVYNALQSLEETINSDGCTQLNGFDTIDVEATTFPVDQDLDDEDRTVGLLQITVTTYK